MSIGEEKQKMEPFYIADRKQNGSVVVEICWFLRKLKIELSHDPTILLIGICSKELKTDIQKITYICIVIAAPKGRNSPNVHQWRNRQNILHTYNGIPLSHKNEVLICATKQMKLQPFYNVKYPLQINSQRWNKDYYLPDTG